jgi:hypothetical protein
MTELLPALKKMDDSGASSHMDFEHGTVPYLLPLPYTVMVTIGNGSQVPVHFYSNVHLCLPSSNFVLKNVLLIHSLIKNLILVNLLVIMLSPLCLILLIFLLRTLG